MTEGQADQLLADMVAMGLWLDALALSLDRMLVALVLLLSLQLVFVVVVGTFYMLHGRVRFR